MEKHFDILKYYIDEIGTTDTYIQQIIELSNSNAIENASEINTQVIQMKDIPTDITFNK